MPEITIVITCFNYGHYLEGCLRSVLAQTYENYEIIVVDDGSTDETPQVMERFANVPNLRYIRQENRGQANAKNKGIHEAQGRYVAFLDADDLWDKCKLEKQVRLFERSEVGVVYSKSRPIDKNGNLLNWGRPPKYLVSRSGKVSNWLFLDNFVVFSSSIVRKDCFSQIGVFNESLSMGIDWDLWLRMSTICEFDFVDQELVLYRIGHPGQMSKNVEMRQKCSDLIMESFLREYPGILENKTIIKAYSYTYCNRGDYFRDIDKSISNKFYYRALQSDPFNKRSYIGLLRNLIF